MLTGDLVRVRINGKDIYPSFVKPDDPRLLERAEDLCTVFHAALQQKGTRGGLQEAVAEIEGLDTDHKLTKGLGKVLLDRCEFAVGAELDPVELRARLFSLAASRGPLSLHAGPTGRATAADVLAALAAELGHSPDVLAASLYADRKDEQVVTAFDDLDPPGLLHRYNLALVQSVLLKASELSVTLSAPDPKRVRQLYRQLKFFGLMYRVERDGADVTLRVDGPASLLKQSTRYGMQLATFFPSLPLLPTPWAMEAEIRWGKRGLRKQLCVSSAQGLQSERRDQGAWRSRTEQFFEDRFTALDSGWELLPGEPLDLGGQDLLVPDFTFRKGGRTAHLDIVGYWRKGYLKKRLAATPDNVILAVSKRLAGEAGDAPPKSVVTFAEIIPAGQVLARIEAVAR